MTSRSEPFSPRAIAQYRQKTLARLKNRIAHIEADKDNPAALIEHFYHLFVALEFCEQDTQDFLDMRVKLIDTLRDLPLQYGYRKAWSSVVKAAWKTLPSEWQNNQHIMALIFYISAKIAHEEGNASTTSIIGEVAFDYAKKGKDIDLIIDVAQMLCSCYLYQESDKHHIATKVLSSAQERLEALGAPMLKRLTLQISEADALRRNGDVRRGFILMENVAKVGLELPLSPQEHAFIHLQRGIMRQAVGNYEGALNDLSQSATYYTQTGQWAAASGAWGDMGLTLWGIGELDVAETTLMRALTLAQQSGDTQRAMKINGNLGLVYLSMGKFLQAEQYITLHLNMAQTLNARREYVRARGNLGMTRLYMGYPEKALPDMLYNIDYHSAQNEARANSLITLALCYHSLNDRLKAQHYLQQALSIGKDKQGTPLHVIILRVMAELSPEREEALLRLQKARQLAETLSRKLDHAGCLLKLSYYEEDMRYYQEAKSLLISIGASAWLDDNTPTYPLLPLVV